jgi:dTDP-4-dehydrorhamnose reductase
VNVAPLLRLVRLAVEHHAKPMFILSPMTVSRRVRDGQICFLGQENVARDPDGLLNAYAQSKWVAERVLWTAAERGLPVKIFRTSHALPSSRTGVAKAHDTYVTVLEVACRAGAVPDWSESAMQGVPVDVLANLLVERSLARDDYRGVIHLENRRPMSMEEIVRAMLRTKGANEGEVRRISLREWMGLCVEAASELQEPAASLAKGLFVRHDGRSAVEAMLSRQPVDVGYFERNNLASRLDELTPAHYWRALVRRARW